LSIASGALTVLAEARPAPAENHMEQMLRKIIEMAEPESGRFLTMGDERFYVIRDVDRLPPFFMTIVSGADHWLFVSSTGGLTAGRGSPDTALFPYVPVDRIHESSTHTGSLTLLRVRKGEQLHSWDPFRRDRNGLFTVSRNVYKSVTGDKVLFEEVNHELRLAFRYLWTTSDRYGFVRSCELSNLDDEPLQVQMLDGLRNILPAGTPRSAQTESSNLVDAYKWSELDETSGLAVYTLYSGISDRAEPCESLRANTVFCLGLEGHRVLLSDEQTDRFRRGRRLIQDVRKRGLRGAFLVNASFELAPGDVESWRLVADVERSQSQAVRLQRDLADPIRVDEAVTASIEHGSDELARIVAGADGLQASAEEHVSTHHYANVLFNVLRGGIFADQYRISARDLSASVRQFNRDIHARSADFFQQLPDSMTLADLLAAAARTDDPQLQRVCYEYLPITFGRRHGDPSRPWNHFSIRLRDGAGQPILSYQGNWRDIFQNWEALTISYPEFVDGVIAKFVNASTMDGYNPYRITSEGIDWEVEEPDNPWSHIGYWGDHQIIYLLKLLELSGRFHPRRLSQLLRREIFSYANVPYRIHPFESLLEDAKNTIDYDHVLAGRIEQRVAQTGADGRLVLESDGEVYVVSLLEKLLVPLLAKLGNLVVDGGIWLNTQRPEWNDANNALVGNGLSMVTLYYLRRYVHFLRDLLDEEEGAFELSAEVAGWLTQTASAIAGLRPSLASGPIDPELRFAALKALGSVASEYRETVYGQGGFSGKVARSADLVRQLLDDACAVFDHSIRNNRRDDGLYHAYNLLARDDNGMQVDPLYLMLEGQVAALSSGAVGPTEACDILESLFESDLYRPDQRSFMLYPDRELPGFFEKNRIPAADMRLMPWLAQLAKSGDDRIVTRDAAGDYRFNADFRNAGELRECIETLVPELGPQLESASDELLRLYEQVFDHRAFTGRSGTMFGFEGLGCIYWHMVSKLLLATQDVYFAAVAEGADVGVCARLGRFYYRIREGIGFNKSPMEYGAFPTDPYSHTPKHAGAQQPGMTGQVKEEVLTRFGELGLRVGDGALRFEAGLLRPQEFCTEPRAFRYLDIEDRWQTIDVPADALAYSWCQVPVIYHLSGENRALAILTDDGKTTTLPSLQLPEELSTEVFARSGRVRRIDVTLKRDDLFAG
jgi:hypothetical protein